MDDDCFNFYFFTKDKLVSYYKIHPYEMFSGELAIAADFFRKNPSYDRVYCVNPKSPRGIKTRWMGTSDRPYEYVNIIGMAFENQRDLEDWS